MKTQNYANHVRFYPPHHFVFLPLIMAMTIGSGWCAFHYPAERHIWVAFTAAFAMIAFAGTMMRQHYALGNQDRIVRLELRLRYYQLTGERLEPVEARLSFGQIAALRFAPDAELPALVKRALSENLPASDIKKAVRDWLPDEMRC